MEENKKCEFLYDMDLFGKTPELYIKRKPKNTTELGITLTIIYIIIYIAFFIYKLVRMVKRMDVTFYDTFAYKNFPYLNVTNEEFYGAFSMGFMRDEKFYYIKSQFVYEVKTPEGYIVEKAEELEIEHCDINKFGSRYRELFKDKGVENLYCVKNVNQSFEGYSNLERYSYVIMKFYPCINKTRTGEDCYPRPYVEQFFKKNIIEFKMQDNLLSPEVYDKPIEVLEKDLNSPVFSNLYQYIYSYIQIVNLETDEDITGLNFWSKNKVEKFPKYDESFIIAAPQEENILETGGPVAEVILQLAAKVLTTKRKYPTLLDVLGDVGGLMEILYTFFNLIASFLNEVIYDKSLVNSLFSFNIDKNEIYIKTRAKRNIKLNSKLNENIDSISIENNNSKNFSKIISERVNLNLKQSDNNLLNTDKKPNELDEIKEENEITVKKVSKKDIRRRSTKRQSHSKLNFNENENVKRHKIVEKEDENNSHTNELDGLKIKNDNIEIYRTNAKQNKETIITLIKVNACCYCFLRKEKNIDVNLLDEGMRLISENLDIINIFVKLNEIEKIKENILLSKLDNIQMSKTCKYYLDIIKREVDNPGDKESSEDS